MKSVASPNVFQDFATERILDKRREEIVLPSPFSCFWRLEQERSSSGDNLSAKRTAKEENVEKIWPKVEPMRRISTSRTISN